MPLCTASDAGDDDALLQRFADIAVWRSGDTRAPHKPLLLLLALARLQRGDDPAVRFAADERTLRDLLRQFGRPRTRQRPEYPFWRLQNDGIWAVQSNASLQPNAAGDVPAAQLRKNAAVGRLDHTIETTLRHRPQLVNRIAGVLLDAQWEHSLHEEILDAVGFPFVVEYDDRRRDPEFRRSILRVYQRACAFCGYDAQLAAGVLAIDAAHVRSFSQGGPNEISNGLALCSLHHRAFDHGALSVDDEHRIMVSEELTGGSVVSRTLVELAGRSVAAPLPGNPRPELRHLAWHRKEIFRAPARRSA